MSLEIKDITSGYQKDNPVLHGVSILADKSKVTCIIGPNGAGKSTILKTIYGNLKPTQGKILLDGEDITGISSHLLPRKEIRYVLQRRHVFPYLNVRENLEMGAWLFRKDKQKVTDSINEIFDRFPVLREKEKMKASVLSGGQQRMLEIGAALITQPKVIMIDEPSAGLAPKVAKAVYQKLKDLRDEKVTILIVDHNVREVISLSDYVYIIKHGQNAGEGRSEDFQDKLEQLIGDWLI